MVPTINRFTGAKSNDIYDPGNWSLNRVPSPDGEILIITPERHRTASSEIRIELESPGPCLQIPVPQGWALRTIYSDTVMHEGKQTGIRYKLMIGPVENCGPLVANTVENLTAPANDQTDPPTEELNLVRCPTCEQMVESPLVQTEYRQECAGCAGKRK